MQGTNYCRGNMCLREEFRAQNTQVMLLDLIESDGEVKYSNFDMSRMPSQARIRSFTKSRTAQNSNTEKVSDDDFRLNWLSSQSLTPMVVKGKNVHFINFLIETHRFSFNFDVI